MSIRNTRPISWIKSARKAFDAFPSGAQDDILSALTFAGEGGFPTDAKPLKGVGPGVFEIALRHRTDAYRAVYTVQFRDTIWVVHAFQKKSKSGIKTPREEIDLVEERIRRLKENLNER